MDQLPHLHRGKLQSSGNGTDLSVGHILQMVPDNGAESGLLLHSQHLEDQTLFQT